MVAFSADTKAIDPPSLTDLPRFNETSELTSKHRNGATYLMSAMVNRRMSVQIMPRMSLRFPSMMSYGIQLVPEVFQNVTETPSGPMFVSMTPRDLMNSSAMFTFSAFCMRIRGVLL